MDMSDALIPTQIEHDHGCKVRPLLPDGWIAQAIFYGKNNCYRSLLVHRWSNGPLMLFAMMNPSGADIRYGDTTVLKTAQIARYHRCGGQIIVNACDWRSVDPGALLECEAPCSDRNLIEIELASRLANYVVVAHGNLPKGLEHYAKAMVSVLADTGLPLYVLGLTNNGNPMHPLARGRNHIRIDTPFIHWRPAS